MIVAKTVSRLRHNRINWKRVKPNLDFMDSSNTHVRPVVPRQHLKYLFGFRNGFFNRSVVVAAGIILYSPAIAGFRVRNLNTLPKSSEHAEWMFQCWNVERLWKNLGRNFKLHSHMPYAFIQQWRPCYFLIDPGFSLELAIHIEFPILPIFRKIHQNIISLLTK